MRIKNATPYRTADLRALVLAALRAEGIEASGYIVEVGASKRQPRRRWDDELKRWVPDDRDAPYRFSGLGMLNRRWFRLGIPKAVYARDLAPEEVKRLAQIAVHELGHNLGLRHADMVGSFGIPVPWADGLAVRLAEVKPAPRRDLQAERAERARAKLEEHERKLRREQKLVRKYRAKVRYYERRRTAAAQK